MTSMLRKHLIRVFAGEPAPIDNTIQPNGKIGEKVDNNPPNEMQTKRAEEKARNRNAAHERRKRTAIKKKRAKNAGFVKVSLVAYVLREDGAEARKALRAAISPYRQVLVEEE